LNLVDGAQVTLDNPTNMPAPEKIASIEEPVVAASIMTPKEFIGNVMELCHNYRGVYVNTEYIDDNRVNLHFDMPLNEIIYDFFDALKSNSRGYASLDYEFKVWQVSDLVKLDMMINNEQVDALTFILHRDDAYRRGRAMAEKLQENIPRQQFEIPIQACVGGRIIARETVRAYRKDVTAKCYGGDISRKKKLLEKQKEGKKRMRQVGSVEVPQEAFMSVLRLGTD
jgi:GTP-binding protein LepA